MRLLERDRELGRDNYYETTVRRGPVLPPLQGEVRADAVIVGGGFAGLSCALELAQRGWKVVLLEAGRLGAGASGRNGGQVIVGVASGQETIERQLGREDARRVWAMALEGVRLIDERIAAHGIECERVHGYLTVAESPRKAQALREQVEYEARAYDFPYELAEGDAVRQYIDSPRYLACAFDRVSGHLNPLQYTLGLAAAASAAGVTLHEHSAALDITHGSEALVRTGAGCVRAKFALLAGNFMLPAIGPRLAPQLARRIMPVGTYIAATAPLDEAVVRRLVPSNAAVCDNNFVLDYFRFSADHRLLFGGRVSYSTRTPPDLAAVMQRRIAAVFPLLQGVAVEHLWGGFVDISMNRAPDFGRLAPNVYYLQGFSGHGVALAGFGGRLVAEAMGAQAERFDVFARLRHHAFPGGAALRTPMLVLGMAYHRLKDLL